MDVQTGKSADDYLKMANDLYQKKLVKEALKVLKKLNKKNLEPTVKAAVIFKLAACYTMILDHKSALIYISQHVELAAEIYNKLHPEYASSLHQLAKVQASLQMEEADGTIQEALTIMMDLGLTNDSKYGLMCFTAGALYFCQTNPAKALIYYEKSKKLVEKMMDDDYYALLMTNMALCHKELHQWNEAHAALKECLLNKSKLKESGQATILYTLGGVYASLKQYEKDLPLLEESASIQEAQKYLNIKVMREELAVIREQARNPLRETIDVGHEYRMCNHCERIKNDSRPCGGCYKVFYCDEECQHAHWATHKPDCHVCFQCSTPLDRKANILRCSACKKAMYCNLTCQLAHWEGHKADCKKNRENSDPPGK